MTTPMWTPDPADAARSSLTAFTDAVTARTGRTFDGYDELLRWSVEDLETFWRCIWDFFDVRAEAGSETVLTGRELPGARWFPDARLNYVDQVFRAGRPDDAPALVELDETGARRDLTWRELRERTAGLAAHLRSLGVGPGDRVVGYLPNGHEAVVAFLATAAIGAVWSACGMDYAPSAALGRFAQLEPAVLVAADGYRNGGRTYERVAAVAEVRAGLPTLRATIAVDRLGTAAPDDATPWADITPMDGLQIDPVPFAHPLWVLFSSGTTGLPKGIVHGHGGVLLEHLKAVALQNDLRAGDVFWWYTTPSWMMWNFQVAGLLVGATIVCYDGSPAHPAPDALWRVAAELGVAVLGTSPAYLTACAKAGVEPARDHDLSRLRTLGVTGSTLAAPSYTWIAEHVGARVQIASITGGTDVVTAFAGSAPTVPVWAGEISAAYLGVALDAYDPSGRSVQDEVGELVITAPMPSMPVAFWNDTDTTTGGIGARYREAYFDTFPGVWRHGDWITRTGHGSIVMHGRSDATLNRNGIRMGSADIYEAVEVLPEVAEALVIGVDEPDGGYWMPLFVRLQPDALLDDGLRARLRAAIREHASPRHVPDEVFAAPGIPHTRTGKKLEVPIKRLLQDAGAAAAFDPGSVDDPGLVDWYLEIGARHRAAAAPAASPQRPGS